ncbi:MBL fold metallo-hydrolase [Candidatus Micrarchaeota archaeon]|nr:MBL fold metallo-hydrolase [Candidatus Micrarchaeota archaeon]
MRSAVLEISKVICPPIFTNCYLAVDAESRKAVAIDPGFTAGEKMPFAAAELNAQINFIIDTHGHWDHTANNYELRKQTQAKLLIHPLDAPLLAHPQSRRFAIPWEITPAKPDSFLSDGQKIKLGTTTLEVMHTPGHTPGSACIYSLEDGLVFTGDTLFEKAMGRTDFEGGNRGQILQSLRRIASLPPQTRVLPGHGVETTIGNESKWITELE